VKDGEIVGPTLADDNLLYFPALQIEGAEALRQAMLEIPNTSGVDLPIIWRFGWGGRKLPELGKAWQAAWEYSNSVIRRAKEEE